MVAAFFEEDIGFIAVHACVGQSLVMPSGSAHMRRTQSQRLAISSVSWSVFFETVRQDYPA
jgi:hypothetical protein